MRVIGLMSGTSLDGVDAAWIETDGVAIDRLGPTLTRPMPPDLRVTFRSLMERAPSLAPDDPILADAVARLTRLHADAVAGLRESGLDLIGFHGQTILHDPDHGRTWQVGDASLLAKMTGVPVAHDFRTADVAAGGQGAPLAPVFHQALARGLPGPVAVLNVGGVANVSWIGGDGLVAMDTGPGNGPLDDWAARHTGAAFDADGALAASGRADATVLEYLLADPYFARPAPKSLDRLAFAQRLAGSGLDRLGAADGAATLVAFTAEAVACAPLPAPPCRWLVCGGGRRNPALMAALRRALAATVEPVEAVGWDGDAMEAQCFGYLAARVAAGLPLTFPGATGVSTPERGGRITHG